MVIFIHDGSFSLIKRTWLRVCGFYVWISLSVPCSIHTGYGTTMKIRPHTWAERTKLNTLLDNIWIDLQLVFRFARSHTEGIDSLCKIQVRAAKERLTPQALLPDTTAGNIPKYRRMKKWYT